MTNLIMDTDKALYEALGFLKQAEMLVKSVRMQDPDTHELTDTHTLMQDALSQLHGELANRVETKWGAA